MQAISSDHSYTRTQFYSISNRLSGFLIMNQFFFLFISLSFSLTLCLFLSFSFFPTHAAHFHSAPPSNLYFDICVWIDCFRFVSASYSVFILTYYYPFHSCHMIYIYFWFYKLDLPCAVVWRVKYDRRALPLIAIANCMLCFAISRKIISSTSTWSNLNMEYGISNCQFWRVNSFPTIFEVDAKNMKKQKMNAIDFIRTTKVFNSYLMIILSSTRQ